MRPLLLFPLSHRPIHLLQTKIHCMGNLNYQKRKRNFCDYTSDVREEKLYLIIWFISTKKKPPSLIIYLVRCMSRTKTMSRPGRVRVFSALVMCVGKKPESGLIFVLPSNATIYLKMRFKNLIINGRLWACRSQTTTASIITIPATATSRLIFKVINEADTSAGDQSGWVAHHTGFDLNQGLSLTQKSIIRRTDCRSWDQSADYERH
jgi:hypothetical protein